MMMSQGFSAAITACEKGCQWEMALGVLQGMPQAPRRQEENMTV